MSHIETTQHTKTAVTPAASSSLSPSTAPIASSLPSSSTSSSTASASVASSIAVQNGLIIQLVRSSESHLRTSQRCSMIASDRLRKIERVSQKLVTAHRELTLQADSCRKMVEELAQGCEEMDQQTLEVEKQFQIHQAQLQIQLDVLQRTRLAEIFKTSVNGVNGVGGGTSPSPGLLVRGVSLTDPSGSPQTLYDFVDTDSIQTLHTNHLMVMSSMAQLSEQARNHLLQPCQLQLDEIRKMEEELKEAMENNATTTTKTTTTTKDNTTNESNTPTTHESLPSPLAHASQAHANMEREVNELSRLFSEQCSTYDRVRSAAMETPNSATGGNGGSSQVLFDISSAIDDIRSTDRHMSTISSRISELGHDVEVSSDVIGTIYQRTLDLFHTLTSFPPSLKTTLANFHTLKKQGEVWLQQASSTRIELHNLKIWFEQFEKSYYALLEEIQRRHRHLAHLEAFVSTVQQQLRDWSFEESSERSTFDNLFGRYLPNSLCPSIYEKVPEIEVSNLETFKTELPIFLPTMEEQVVIRRMIYGEEEIQQPQQQQPNQTMMVNEQTTQIQADTPSIPTQQSQSQSQQQIAPPPSGPSSLSGSDGSVHNPANESLNAPSPIQAQQVQPLMDGHGGYPVGSGVVPPSGDVSSASIHDSILPPLQSIQLGNAIIDAPSRSESPPPHVQMQKLAMHLSRQQQPIQATTNEQQQPYYQQQQQQQQPYSHPHAHPYSQPHPPQQSHTQQQPQYHHFQSQPHQYPQPHPYGEPTWPSTRPVQANPMGMVSGGTPILAPTPIQPVGRYQPNTHIDQPPQTTYTQPYAQTYGAYAHPTANPPNVPATMLPHLHASQSSRPRTLSQSKPVVPRGFSDDD